MPTYDYRCPTCGAEESVIQSISSYSASPLVPLCAEHGKMERRLSVVPGMSGLANALAGDRHYDGMRAPDGSDISSRTKHREYMKRTGLTTADDFKGQWAAAQKEREAIRAGNFKDPERKKVIEEVVTTAINN